MKLSRVQMTELLDALNEISNYAGQMVEEQDTEQLTEMASEIEQRCDNVYHLVMDIK